MRITTQQKSAAIIGRINKIYFLSTSYCRASQRWLFKGSGFLANIPNFLRQKVRKLGTKFHPYTAKGRRFVIRALFPPSIVSYDMPSGVIMYIQKRRCLSNLSLRKEQKEEEKIIFQCISLNDFISSAAF